MSLPGLAAVLQGLFAIFQPGTQPGELTLDIRSPALCKNCHGGYAEYAANDTWQGTMMANATRDPLFQAALTIANQDEPGAGDVCLRCHTPRGWLFGRSEPPDGSALEEPDDFEGVSCDFCHRLRAGRGGLRYLGNAQFFVADDFVRRGPLADAAAPHEWRYSEYFEQSELCGLCHDVSNPLRGGFAIERTYTEWKTSAFPAEGVTCQTCHLPSEPGQACGAPGAPDRDVHRHELAGGNAWMPLVLAGEFPELERGDAYQRTADNARAMLAAAAALSLELPAEAVAGSPLELAVRVENRTGHKLPTGYPEGRRCWLELEITDAAGEVVLHSGAYDPAAADRIDDEQLHTYEVRMAADGLEGFHFILQDELLQDNRIPPRGFVPRADTAPVGRTYPRQPDGTLAHWDEAPYLVAELAAEAQGPLTVRATLWYQTASKEYVNFLADDNRTDERGQRLRELWERYDRSPPVAMATVTGTIPAAPEAGEEGGCQVSRARDQIVAFGFALLVVLVRFLTRRRA